MPLGIINTTESHAPGTVLLYDDEIPQAALAFKHGSGKNKHLILIPQPSSDPNDPLNWPRWKKDAVFMVVFINTIILASVPSPMLAPSTLALTTILDVSLNKVAELSGYQLLVVGCIGPIVSALARKYGKRPQFVFACVMAVIGTIICIGAGTRYNVLMAGRVVQGFGTTAFESLSVAVLGDMYFVHERPIRTGGMTLTLTCMSSLVAIIGGPITLHLGWRYMFYIYLPFVVAGSVAIILFLPETQYRRSNETLAPMVTAMDELTTAVEVKGHHAEAFEDVKIESDLEPARTNTRDTPARKTYVQELAIFHGTFTDVPLWKLLLSPFVALANPAVIWTLLVAGVAIALFVTTSYILAQIWSPPPYLLTTAGNGFFYVGALIGGLTGGLFGAWLCDFVTIRFIRANHGVYEPEFRIPVQIVSATLFGLGWFLWMWQQNHPTPHGYYLGAFCHGIICFALTGTTVSANLYILDSYRDQTTDIFVLQMTTKNLLFYGFSLFINSWTAEIGAGAVFRTWGIVALCLLSTCIPMYVFGKIIRKTVHKWEWMKKLGAGSM